MTVPKRIASTQEKYPDFLDDQRQFFDEMITEEWHTYDNPEWDKRRRFEVDRLFRLVSARKILDVGCGCGFHDRLMAEKPGVELVVGIDYSQKSIEAANREYRHPNVRRHVEDIHRMTADGAYDLVVSFQVIEHLSDAAAFLESCRRQAAPGGHVAVFTPNRLRLVNRLRLLVGGQPKFVDPQHYAEFVCAEVIELGRERGLEYVSGFSYGMSLRIPWTNLMLLPTTASLRVGHSIPSWADCFCVVFKNR